MMADSRSLHVELRAGQSISMDGGRIIVQLMDKSGKVAQLRITAPPDVAIQRPSSTASSGADQARHGIMPKMA